MAVDPRQIFDYLILTHQVSVASAAGILANIQHESGFDPTIYGDDGTSAGLFQHHAGRLAALKNYAASQGKPWTDWRVQVDFAMKEARQMGLNLQHTDPAQAASEWTLKFERPENAQVRAQERARSASAYMYTSSQGVGASGNAAPQEGEESLVIPTGGSYVQIGGETFVAYRLGNTKAHPVVVYRIPREQLPGGAGVSTISQDDFATWKAAGHWVDGGSVEAFRGVPEGTSYQQLLDDVLMELGLAGTDAMQDMGVMEIVAIALTREMSEAELANRLRRTDWFQARSDAEREWDDLSDAEKEQRIVDRGMELAQLWFTYVGEDLAVHEYDVDGDGYVSAAELQKGNKDLYQWALNVASGKSSQVQAVNTWLKAEALNNPNSPWGRTLREEEQAQGQHQVDVENKAEQIRDLYFQWGIPISEGELMKMAEQVVMNTMSDADIESDLRDQAQALYPHKPANLTTRQWATPYMMMYQNTLETPEVGLDDPLLQRGLSEAMTLADFKKMLRADDRWLDTENARTEFNDKVGALGRVMGF